MTIQEYYELQAKLMALDKSFNGFCRDFESDLEDVRDTFNKIDVNTLGAGTPTPAGTAVSQPVPTNSGTPPPPPTTTNSSTSAPVMQPKVRKKLNTPVITGPLGDVVKDILAEKEQAAQEAKGPQRTAPYEVEVKNVSLTPNGDYVARVEDSKNNMEAYVPIGQATYEEFNRDPNGLVIDLNKETLTKTEWLPLSTTDISHTLQDVIDSNDSEAAAMAQSAANNLGVDPSQVVFTNPNQGE